MPLLQGTVHSMHDIHRLGGRRKGGTIQGQIQKKNLRGGPESTYCKMKGIHSKNVQH